jgi:hypothetical protein
VAHIIVHRETTHFILFNTIMTFVNCLCNCHIKNTNILINFLHIFWYLWIILPFLHNWFSLVRFFWLLNYLFIFIYRIGLIIFIVNIWSWISEGALFMLILLFRMGNVNMIFVDELAGFNFPFWFSVHFIV